MNINNGIFFVKVMLLLLAAKECRTQLTCYVCNHCEKITPITPVKLCGEDDGDTSATDRTLLSITTTRASTPASATTEFNTLRGTTEVTGDNGPRNATTAPTTTTVDVSDGNSTATTFSSRGDELSPVTLPTTTTAHRNVTGDAITSTIARDPSDILTTSEGPQQSLRLRQLRSVTGAPAAYHCYTVKMTYNNTMNTQRGCARAVSEEAACSQLRMSTAPNTSIINRCQYCTTSRCNGGSALQVPLLALLAGLTAIVCTKGL